MFNIFHTYSRRQIFRISGGLLIGAVASSSFPLLRTLAVGRSKTVLRFQFTTAQGGKGSFYLDTNTAPSSEPAIFGPGITGISYPLAVSDFSFSSPYVDLKKEAANWDVAPKIPLNISGRTGVLSGVSFPSGCSTGSAFSCLINIAVLYSGSDASLSAEPNSYPLAIGVDFFDPATRQLIVRDDATDLKVIALPEVVDGG